MNFISRLGSFEFREALVLFEDVTLVAFAAALFGYDLAPRFLGVGSDVGVDVGVGDRPRTSAPSGAKVAALNDFVDGRDRTSDADGGPLNAGQMGFEVHWRWLRKLKSAPY